MNFESSHLPYHLFHPIIHFIQHSIPEQSFQNTMSKRVSFGSTASSSRKHIPAASSKAASIPRRSKRHSSVSDAQISYFCFFCQQADKVNVFSRFSSNKQGSDETTRVEIVNLSQSSEKPCPRFVSEIWFGIRFSLYRPLDFERFLVNLSSDCRRNLFSDGKKSWVRFVDKADSIFGDILQ